MTKENADYWAADGLRIVDATSGIQVAVVTTIFPFTIKTNVVDLLRQRVTLLAAAPDLLRACQEALENIQTGSRYRVGVMMRLNEAIKKASPPEG